MADEPSIKPPELPQQPEVIPTEPTPDPTATQPSELRRVFPVYVGGPLDGEPISDDARKSGTTMIVHAPQLFHVGAGEEASVHESEGLTFYVPYPFTIFSQETVVWLPEYMANRSNSTTHHIVAALFERAHHEHATQEDK